MNHSWYYSDTRSKRETCLQKPLTATKQVLYGTLRFLIGMLNQLTMRNTKLKNILRNGSKKDIADALKNYWSKVPMQGQLYGKTKT